MLTYALQVSVCWAFFYAAYYALLSRETFFHLNRLWLLLSWVCGLALPLIAPFFEVAPDAPVVLLLEPFVVSASALQNNIQNTEGAYLSSIVGWLYGFGVVFFGTKLLVGLVKIYQLKKTAALDKQADFTLALSDEPIVPFSFFNYIFINPKLIEATDFQQVMQHEKAHVAQRHSVDVVLIELVSVFFWWCPLVYFFKKSLRNVHEYAADAAVLRTTTTPQYGRLLLRQTQSGMSWSLANHFFSQLKKRILMMTRSQSKRRMLAKYALAVPIFLLLVVLLASPKTQVLAETKRLTEAATETAENLENKVVESAKGTDNQSVTAESKNNSTLNNLGLEAFSLKNLPPQYAAADTAPKPTDKQSPRGAVIFELNDMKATTADASPVLTIVPHLPEYEGGMQKLFQFLAQNIKYPVKARESGVQGTVYVGFVVETDGAISHPQVKRGVSSDIDAEALRVISMMPKWKAGRNEEGKNVRVAYTLPIKFKLDDKAVVEKVVTEEEKKQLTGSVKVPTVTDKNAIVEVPIDKKEVVKDGIYTIVNQQPEFIGGIPALFKWLGEQIKYPAKARENGVQGTVYVGFVVEKDGSISNVEVKRDVPIMVSDTIKVLDAGGGISGNKIIKKQAGTLGEEAKRVVSMMPKWKAGKNNEGQAVRVAYTLPIKFKLE